MSELKAPECPECRRPLQRGKDRCMYCGYVLNEAEVELVKAALTDEAVEKHLKQAQALLDANLPQTSAKPRGPWFKIIVILLSLGAMAGFAWVSQWNIIVIILAVLFFSIPIWRVLR